MVLAVKKFLRDLNDFKILWLLAMGMATWIGTRIVTPLNQVGANTDAISANTKALNALTLRANARDSADREWQEVVKIVVRVQCKALSEDDKYKYNLCSSRPVVQP